MLEKDYLKERYAAIFSAVGYILLVAAVVALLPLTLLLFYPEEAGNAKAFGLLAGGMGLFGFTLRKMFNSETDVSLSFQEGGVIVLLGWVLVMAFSAWPFMVINGLSFSRAFFESVSGWTTTGLSVIDVTRAGPMVLLWRSIIQLAGGAGLAIIMMSAIVGPTGIGISSAEGRSNQLVPQVRQSARLVLIIYGCYAVIGSLAYRIAGMSWFDAVNHSFAAVSTGGFSTRAASIGYWDSAVIEAVSLPLMLLGNLSFVTAWYLWRGRFRTVFRNGEVRLLAVLIPLASAVIFIFTSRVIYPSVGKSIRIAVFDTVSAMTTTGFSTVGYTNWNSFGLLLFISLMIIGGGTCSTAGGIKQFRIYLLLKLFFWEFRRYLLPKTAIQERLVWEGNRPNYVDDAQLREMTVFILLYLTLYLLGTMVMCASGYGLADSLFEFASALGTVGLSIGITAPQMPDAALWAEIIAMFLGRLEIIVVIVSLFKLARDGRKIVKRPN